MLDPRLAVRLALGLAVALVPGLTVALGSGLAAAPPVAGLPAGPALAASPVPSAGGTGAQAGGTVALAPGTAGTPLAGWPRPTVSYYEQDANLKVLFAQGKAAGERAEQGIVILDFGRPADGPSGPGTMGFGGRYMPFASVVAAVESFIRAYFRYAPGGTTLHVAVGTNNSCGPGQPCGHVTCGCPDEPADLQLWGSELASTVERLGAWATQFKVGHGFSDSVRVVAADDAEPAFDPGFKNTYAVLKGYADAVGGPWPAMVDSGSAEGSYWTKSQLFQVAYGFRPDVPMPQVYYPAQASQWGALLRYAKAKRGKPMTVYGVLTEGPGAYDPGAAYAAMLRVASAVTGQRVIPWVSTITFVPRA